ncbi:MAG: hypothetical protein M3Y91_15735 [Actinomycetota bacterium]|nr:hypothetical protein [Actinomycetota bacterium]
MTAPYLFPDVSNNEPVIDGLAAKQQGMSAIAFKASEGSGFVDRLAAANHDQAVRNGLPFMPYHFMAAGNGAAQAQHFIQCVHDACGAVDSIPLNLDREGGEAADVDAFIREVRVLAPRNPLCGYSAGWADSQFGTSGELARLPLWWSNYVNGAGDPHQLLAQVTPGWFQPFGGFTRYAARQYSSSANVGGINGCDISVCFDDASFAAIFGGSTPTQGDFLMALSDAQQGEVHQMLVDLHAGLAGTRPSKVNGSPVDLFDAALWIDAHTAKPPGVLFFFKRYVTGSAGPVNPATYLTNLLTTVWVPSLQQFNNMVWAMENFAGQPIDTTVHLVAAGYLPGVLVGPDAPPPTAVPAAKA